MKLSIQGLAIRRAGRKVINDLNINLKSGEIVGLFGANGAGKSTLLEGIVGLSRVKSGNIYLDDMKINPLSCRKRIKAGFSYLPQYQTAIGDLSMALNFHIFGANMTAAFVSEIDVAKLADRKIGMLSGGEKRKIDFCLAALIPANIYLLDEPFAGVEPKSVLKMIDHLLHLRALGAIIMIVDHFDVLKKIGLDYGILLRENAPVFLPFQEFVSDYRVIQEYTGAGR